MALMALAAVLTAFAGSVLTVPLFARLARATGIVDRPGPLKVQTAPVPYLGGAAILVGLVAAAWTRAFTEEVHVEVLLPLVLALALGIADDRRELPVLARLVGEVVVGLAVAWAVPSRLGWAAGWPLVVLVVLVLVNGVNLLDGLDALSSGVVAASAIGFAVLLAGSGRIAALSVLGALVGFLLYNRPPARIYLGDGGSYLLGTALALLVVLSWRSTVPLATSISSLPMVALPVAEVAWALVRRRRARMPLFAGDRGHSYDRLAARGMRTIEIAVVAAGAQLLLVLVGLGAAHAGTVGAGAFALATAVLLIAGGGAAGFLRPTAGSPGPLARSAFAAGEDRLHDA